ncbi:MAG: hypothetical protein KatS3mg021_0514 [Fimbriimonadales bacterium]|nr:MAG: hypothetical protein KatS3mg021_0514 [Fimbriimonadales bacterium]
MRVLFATIIGLVWVLTGRAQSVNLQTVPELGKPITVRSARLTLADLVRRVAQETDVRLGVAKEIEQEKLTLFVSEKPAWQILHLAARVLELEWHREPEKGGYYLIRPTTTSPNARRNRELQESRKRMEQALREWQQQGKHRLCCPANPAGQD